MASFEIHVVVHAATADWTNARCIDEARVIAREKMDWNTDDADDAVVERPIDPPDGPITVAFRWGGGA